MVGIWASIWDSSICACFSAVELESNSLTINVERLRSLEEVDGEIVADGGGLLETRLDPELDKIMEPRLPILGPPPSKYEEEGGGDEDNEAGEPIIMDTRWPIRPTLSTKEASRSLLAVGDAETPQSLPEPGEEAGRGFGMVMGDEECVPVAAGVSVEDDDVEFFARDESFDNVGAASAEGT